eukprot:403372627
MKHKTDRLATKNLYDHQDRAQELKKLLNNQFRNVKSASEVHVLLNEAKFIDNVDTLAQLSQSMNEFIKGKGSLTPNGVIIKDQIGLEGAQNKGVNMLDLKLNTRGIGEDETYALDGFLVKNIRRGNTIIEIVEKEMKKYEDGDEVPCAGKVLRRYMGRKGLTKFFDLAIEYVDPRTRYEDNHLSSTSFCIKNQILAEAFQTLLAGDHVEILKTLKANGENAQISYNPDVDCWVSASKNVGILLRDREDIKKYDNQHFNFAKKIADVWFNKLDDLREKDPQLIDQLKKDMANKTLVAEYIGNIEHQHMVKYNQTTLIFYAVVENYSPDICWPTDQALDFFKRYDLNVVRIESHGLYNSYEMLCNGLYKVFRDVAKGKIVDEEEGSVLYLVKRDKDGDKSKDKVLSLAKLKTIEYRIFRKIREKLRGFYRHESKVDEKGRARKSHDHIINAFQREMSSITEGNELPQPIEFYVTLLKASFDYVNDDPEPRISALNNEYINFQEGLLEYHKKKMQLNVLDTNLFESSVLDKQQEIVYQRPQEITQIETPITHDEESKNSNNFKQKLYQSIFILLTPPGILTQDNLDLLQISYNIIELNSNHDDLQSQYEQLSQKLFTPTLKPNLIVLHHITPFLVQLLDQLEQSIHQNDVKLLSYGFNINAKDQFIDYQFKNKEEGLPTSKAALNRYFEDQLVVYQQKISTISSVIQVKNAFQELQNALSIAKSQSKFTLVEGQEESKEVREREQEELKSYEIQQQQRKASEEVDIDILYPTLESKIHELKTMNRTKKIVIVVIPFGTTGSGKSTFKNYLEKYVVDQFGWRFESVSSDECRGKVMQNLMANKKLSREQAFDQSNKNALSMYNDQLGRILRKIDKSPSKINIVYLDKNHPINGLPRAVEVVEQNTPKNVILKKVYLIPKISDPIRRYPFSYNFLIQCFLRLMSRDDHETLDNSNPIETAQILLMFFHLYLHVKFDSHLLQQYRLDNYFKIPLTADCKSLNEVPLSIQSKVDQLFKNTKKGDKPQDLALIQQFIDESLKLKDYYSEHAKIDQTDLDNSILTALIRTLEPYKSDEVLKEEEKVQQSQDQDQNKKDYQDQQHLKKEKLPLYLGVSVEDDPELNKKLEKVLSQTIEQLKQIDSEEEEQKDYEKMLSQCIDSMRNDDKKSQKDTWTKAKSFHVTTAFLGKFSMPIRYQFLKKFEENQDVPVEIRAVVYCKGKIVTSLCRPQIEVQNRIPHMTTMLFNVAAKFSNDILESTCIKGQLFSEIYEETFKNQEIGQGLIENVDEHAILFKKGQVKVHDNKETCYFIRLKEPVVFQGKTKKFYN